MRKEFIHKLNRFEQCVSERTYKKIAEVPFIGFVTKERLSLAEAETMPAKPWVVGTPWGCKFEYGWFFAEIVISEELNGKRVVFKNDMGEGVVFVNGDVYGALDKEHSEITLSRTAKVGEKYSIAYEVYAGHTTEPIETFQHRVIQEDKDYTEFPENVFQKQVQNGEVGIFDDQVYALLMDFRTLNSLYRKISENSTSMRTQMIEKTFEKLCTSFDVEVAEDEFKQQVAQARELLKPLLDCKNGSTAPTVYAVGHSHLDLEWLWTIDETRRKAARTLGNQMHLMEEYPDYTYVQSQPWLFNVIKNEYPDMYSKVKAAVKKGQLVPDGATWVEMDTNIPSGESLVRQFIFGKRFIKEEFGKDSKILWLPDVFGISAALPQIMKSCNVDYLYNAKMMWSYNHGVPIYKGTYKWRGIDGTEVLLYAQAPYNALMTPEQNITMWQEADNTENVPDIMACYGHGDGGGGATREHLEYAIRQSDLEGAPRVKMSDPLDFYIDVEKRYNCNKVFENELWYAEHKSTYTSQSELKKLNRRSEAALHNAEFWTALIGGDKRQQLNELWKEVLFNQFHDILPGTTMKEPVDRAVNSYKNVIVQCDNITNTVLDSVVDNTKDAITVFNALPWARNVEIELPREYTSLKAVDGKNIHTYTCCGKTYANVYVEACGYESYVLDKNIAAEAESSGGELVLQNEYIRAEFDVEGRLISLRSDEDEYIKAPSNEFKLYKNHPALFDAWDIDCDYTEKEVDANISSTAKIVSKTSQKTVLHIIKKFSNSVIEQYVTLKKDSATLDFETKINWQETHKLLKVNFNTNIHTKELMSEIQFGHICRSNHTNHEDDVAQYEKFQHKWSALAENGRMFALLNDSVYGVSADKGTVSLTLLTASMAPMLNADKGEHTFKYSVCVTNQPLDKSPIVSEAYGLNNPVKVVKGFANAKKFFELSKNNIVLETVKTAEDGSGDVIIRMYEAAKKRTNCKLKLGFDVTDAYITNMLEDNVSETNVINNTIELNFKAFEVITVRLHI